MWSEWDYTERDGGEIVLQTTVSGMGNSSDSSASGSRCSGGVGASASGEQKMDVEVETLRKIEDIAGSKFRDGRYSEALQLLLVARPTRERVNGEDGPATLQTLSNLGTLYCAMGKFGEAEAVLARVHEAQLHRSGEHAFDTLRTGEHALSVPQIADGDAPKSSE